MKVHGPPSEGLPMASVDGWQTVVVWSEHRELVGNATATIKAFLVPRSGVGWVDFEWKRYGLVNSPLSETKRLLADWTGLAPAAIMRSMIPLADDWFAYCGEQMEREVAVRGLAGETTKRSPAASGTTGAVASAIAGINMAQQRQRGAAELRRLASPDAREGAVEGMFPALAWQAGLGSTEGTSDGSGGFGDYVAESEVSR